MRRLELLSNAFLPIGFFIEGVFTLADPGPTSNPIDAATSCNQIAETTSSASNNF